MSISFPFGQSFFSSGRFLGAANGATEAQGAAATPTRGNLMQGIGGMQTAETEKGRNAKSGKSVKSGKSAKSGKSGSSQSGSGQNAQGRQGNMNPMQVLDGLRAMMLPGQQPQPPAIPPAPQGVNIPQGINPAPAPGGIPLVQAAPNPFAAIDARINGGLTTINGLLSISGIQPDTRLRILNPNLPL